MNPRFVAKLAELITPARRFESLRDGVDIARLWGDPNAGPSAALLRYAPGAVVPKHRHVGFELIVVLSGSQTDERGTYDAGSVVLNPAGDEHSVRSEAGCTVLILWERPVEFV